MAKTQYLGSRLLAHRIDHLLPDTLYKVSIRAVFSKTEGPEVTLTHRTGMSLWNSPLCWNTGAGFMGCCFFQCIFHMNLSEPIVFECASE